MDASALEYACIFRYRYLGHFHFLRWSMRRLMSAMDGIFFKPVYECEEVEFGMKVGTLTLHLPFNYGNALQMLSLHRYLLEQGYDAEVLSHWFLKNREEITYWHRRIRSASGLFRFVLNALMFNGVVCQFCREAKLMKWLTEKIRWSQEAGVTGEFNPERLPHDIVIAGSDQIWNPKYETSDFFLLPDFPNRIKKIAYAASFGTDCFIEHRVPFFKKAMAKFAAISLRESSAVDI